MPSRTTPRRPPKWYQDMLAAAAQNRARALEMRTKGLTLQEIGDALGVSRQRVHAMIERSKRASKRARRKATAGTPST